MIIEFEEKLLNLIDARIESASDDELFAGGYLRGHISLSAAACEEAGIDDLVEFKIKIAQSLAAARSELSPVDQAIVSELWQQLIEQV
ncbi:YfcL family protein [Vibrio sp. V27_P1S3P104]|uniref:YfcL family protein n=1 Tax=Vibrio TaxID=662 RepID=UPI000C168796|nr:MULTISPECIES: YfcL family protein [Vibrio]NAW68834.1 YfcL family protein [Vibrio sp. V28_P6S34P95]NAX06456.1 YfcL family protein [Vibrio sp. V30_P3S12P165]NAX34396.1 YfcL family protein [Vibrio sp. V29_P1S30P107]NAX37836.1 YfcL family protein [Vibrio sp. V27_P1S3P104]NAX41341.1 YfcL family protein [Vibrio sp. V26_P1S5P106]